MGRVNKMKPNQIQTAKENEIVAWLLFGAVWITALIYCLMLINVRLGLGFR